MSLIRTSVTSTVRVSLTAERIGLHHVPQPDPLWLSFIFDKAYDLGALAVAAERGGNAF